MDKEDQEVSDGHGSEGGSTTGAIAPVKQITNDMMGILGQIKTFVSTLDDHQEQHRPTPRRLRRALSLMTRAKQQLVGSEPASPGDSLNLHEQLAEHVDILQTHIDENLRLRQVKDEVTEVMEMLSSHLERFGLRLTVTSTETSAATSDDGDTSAIERDEDETGTSLAEEEEDTSADNEEDVAEEEEVATSKVEDGNKSEAEDEEANEVEDKSELEDTKEVVEEDAEEAWTDGTDVGTTDEEVSSLASEAMDQDEPALSIRLPANVLLKRFLAESSLKPSFARVEDPEVKGNQYTCTVLSLQAMGSARSRRSAKILAAQDMLRMIATCQEQDTLPPEIKPFTKDELEELHPLLQAVLDNAVGRLKTECLRTGRQPPTYKVLESPNNNKAKRDVRVRCDALDLLAIGVGANKRKARREAAKNLLLEYERESFKKQQEAAQ